LRPNVYLYKEEAQMVRKIEFKGVFLCIAFAAVLNAQDARGACEQEGTCYATDVFENPNGMKKYRVNVSEFYELIPMLGGTSETAVAVIMGADTWNEHANSGHFRYMGTTTATDIPTTYWGCFFNWPSFESIVVPIDAETDHASIVEPRCGGYAFRIKVYTKTEYGKYWLYSTGAPKAGYTDFAVLMAHELGHTHNMLHPQCGEKCTIEDPIGINTIRQRDPAHYDHKCTWETGGYRSLTPYYRFQSSGTFGSEQQITLSTSVFKSGAAVNKISGVFDVNAAFLTSNGGSWVPYIGSTTAKSLGLLTKTSIGPTPTVWREDDSIDRVFYTYYYPLSGDYTVNESIPVSYVRSSNDFQNRTSGGLYRCNSMTSWMSCSSTSRITSAERIAVAWDDLTNRSVTVWADLDRADNASNGDVNISTGYIYHTTIPEPDSIGVSSSVSPGVACKAYQAYGGNDCIVAYVDQNDNLGRIRVKTFYNLPYTSSPPYRYKIYNVQGGGVLDQNMRTASGIAAWYQNGYFYLAFRPTWTSQNLAVYYSYNGYQNWTQSSSFGSSTYSVTAPSAASCYAGSYNTLVYSR
jgi:hypothetical protein